MCNFMNELDFVPQWPSKYWTLKPIYYQKFSQEKNVSEKKELVLGDIYFAKYMK